jgi:hypothetical protein
MMVRFFAVEEDEAGAFRFLSLLLLDLPPSMAGSVLAGVAGRFSAAGVPYGEGGLAAVMVSKTGGSWLDGFFSVCRET